MVGYPYLRSKEGRQMESRRRYIKEIESAIYKLVRAELRRRRRHRKQQLAMFRAALGFVPPCVEESHCVRSRDLEQLKAAILSQVAETVRFIPKRKRRLLRAWKAYWIAQARYWILGDGQLLPEPPKESSEFEIWWQRHKQVVNSVAP
jgi:hypothetical protein